MMLGSVFVLSSASSALSAGIYWTNPGNATIGHANLDGTDVNNNFLGANVFDPGGIDVDASHLYWTYSGCCNNYAYHYIARANLDGTGVNNSFISSQAYPSSVAVGGGYVYWGDEFSSIAGGGGTRPTSIGRANLDGTGATNTFVAGVTPAGIAVDSKYLYWTDFGANKVGRANLDGTGVNNSFISSVGHPNGLMVDGTYIYWTNLDPSCSYCYTSSIGRANLDGTGVNQSFISGIPEPTDVVTDGTYLYWTTTQSYIYRASLDGTGVIRFIYAPSGNGYLAGLAVLVPEPGTGLLVIAGLLGLAGWRRARE
jgi:hypothetical protein